MLSKNGPKVNKINLTMGFGLRGLNQGIMLKRDASL